jgi:phage terminase large subunit-like protein
MTSPYNDPIYKANRKQLLSDGKATTCALCGKPGANTADHIVPLMFGGDNSLDNLQPAHQSCNSRKGATQQNKRAAAQNLKRSQTQPKKDHETDQKTTEQDFFPTGRQTPTLISTIFLGNQPELAGSLEPLQDDWRIGREQPRLESVGVGAESYGHLVAGWAERHMQMTLMPWQIHALSGQLAHDGCGLLQFRESLVSTARQNGKSVALQALIGWWMTEGAVIRGGPQSVMSVANKLDRAEAIFPLLANILVESFGGKKLAAIGRKSVEMPDGSRWEIRAATKSLHGGSHDLIVCDELFDIDAEVVDTALRPSQIARKSPLLSMWSTAGDQNSETMIKLRQQAMADIDKGLPSLFYFAEWSMPPHLSPLDEKNYCWANPSLGTTITIDALRAVSKKDSFMRAHLNQWITARGAWLDLGVWEKNQTDTPMPDTGISYLSVDSSVDDARYCGVRAAEVDGKVIVQTEFVVETEADMWAAIARVMENPEVQLLITPTLDIHVPLSLRRRTTITGYAELTKYTTLVRSMIHEGNVKHHGESLLADHCGRAVLVKTPTGAVVSSQRSPGPIELCRVMIWAVAQVSKPKQKTKPLMVIVGG